MLASHGIMEFLRGCPALLSKLDASLDDVPSNISISGWIDVVIDTGTLVAGNSAVVAMGGYQ